jgi:membrane associated rhomboid family serine protease
MWFVFQLIEGLGMLGGKGSGGVAYAAHVGGFIAGLALITVFRTGLEPLGSPMPPPMRERDEPW